MLGRQCQCYSSKITRAKSLFPDTTSYNDYCANKIGCVWYCGSCYGCGLKKNCFIKSIFN